MEYFYDYSDDSFSSEEDTPFVLDNSNIDHEVELDEIFKLFLDYKDLAKERFVFILDECNIKQFQDFVLKNKL